MEKPLIEMRDIHKSFGPTKVLKGIDLQINHNEVLGLVGDNAAGKSTLMKILSGAYPKDKGEIFFEGKKVNISDPMSAKRLGIEMIYQDLALVPNLNIMQNIFLGREILKNLLGNPVPIFDKPKMKETSSSILNELGIDMPTIKTKVTDLSGGQRQAVAIAKAISFNPKLVIMDEPTAALSAMLAKKVLETIKSFREKGISIVFISHLLQDVIKVADRIVVLRRGEVVADEKASDIKETKVIRLMCGYA